MVWTRTRKAAVNWIIFLLFYGIYWRCHLNFFLLFFLENLLLPTGIKIFRWLGTSHGVRFTLSPSHTYLFDMDSSVKQLKNLNVNKKNSMHFYLVLKTKKPYKKYQIYIFKSFSFSLAKKRSRSWPKILAPAPYQVLNRLWLQLKYQGSSRLRNTAINIMSPWPFSYYSRVAGAANFLHFLLNMYIPFSGQILTPTSTLKHVIFTGT